jgi:hypothetical protein
MISSIMIHRLRWPAFIVLVGVLALLNQANILHWHQSWPFFLILFGVLSLAERAAWSADGGYPQPPAPGSYPGTPNPQAGYSPAGTATTGTASATPVESPIAPPRWQEVVQPASQPGSAIVPVPAHEIEKYTSGGQS